MFLCVSFPDPDFSAEVLLDGVSKLTRKSHPAANWPGKAGEKEGDWTERMKEREELRPGSQHETPAEIQRKREERETQKHSVCVPR